MVCFAHAERLDVGGYFSLDIPRSWQVLESGHHLNGEGRYTVYAARNYWCQVKITVQNPPAKKVIRLEDHLGYTESDLIALAHLNSRVGWTGPIVKKTDVNGIPMLLFKSSRNKTKMLHVHFWIADKNFTMQFLYTSEGIQAANDIIDSMQSSNLVSDSCFVSDNADYEKAVIDAAQIIKTQILPRYEREAGFDVKPMDIKYDSDPTIAKFLNEFGSIWKRLNPVVAERYSMIQQRENERTRPDANRLRGPIVAVINRAIELRGGGSASGALDCFALAHQEWIIAHLATGKAEDISHQEFVSRLLDDLSVAQVPQHEVEGVLDALKAVERLLTKNEGAFLRAQFLLYFEWPQS
jgi:hypothetical protein